MAVDVVALIRKGELFNERDAFRGSPGKTYFPLRVGIGQRKRTGTGRKRGMREKYCVDPIEGGLKGIDCGAMIAYQFFMLRRGIDQSGIVETVERKKRADFGQNSLVCIAEQFECF